MTKRKTKITAKDYILAGICEAEGCDEPTQPGRRFHSKACSNRTTAAKRLATFTKKQHAKAARDAEAAADAPEPEPSPPVEPPAGPPVAPPKELLELSGYDVTEISVPSGVLLHVTTRALRSTEADTQGEKP